MLEDVINHRLGFLLSLCLGRVVQVQEVNGIAKSIITTRAQTDDRPAIDAPHGLSARCDLKDCINSKHSISQRPNLYVRSATGGI